MNYRHAYHAGNFADVMKHALLIRLIAGLQRKPAPLLVLDTHAGAGRYGLGSAEAQKTGEWREGIGRVLAEPPEALAEYAALVAALGLYPGSPLIAAHMLRAQDRLIACELHPEDAAALRRLMRGKNGVAVHERDGHAALKAFLPPPERRALILIDPPFERADEFAQLAKTLESAWRKFPSGVFAIWYPIKHRAPVREFFEVLAQGALRDVAAAELLRRPDTDPASLNGCGLLIVNPPYGFEGEAAPILAACASLFSAPGCGGRVERLIDE